MRGGLGNEETNESKNGFYFQIDLLNRIDGLATLIQKKKKILNKVHDQQHSKVNISQVHKLVGTVTLKLVGTAILKLVGTVILKWLMRKIMGKSWKWQIDFENPCLLRLRGLRSTNCTDA